MASKSKPVAEQQVYDTNTTSTGAFDVPAGTTAQRPGSPTSGMLRFNTDINVLENYDGNNWLKVSAVIPILDSVTGTLLEGFTNTLTLAGNGFLTSNLTVKFTPSGGSTTDVVVTPTSDTAATVAVPAAIYGQSAGTVIGIAVQNSDLQTSNSINKTTTAMPTGGTITTSGNYRIHQFNSSSNFVTSTALSNVEYLIIAGGAAGGGTNATYGGGGGGAGGYRSSVVGQVSGGGASAESRMTLSAATYDVEVGAAASAGAGRVSGNDSSFNNTNVVSGAPTIVSTGGGGGAAASAQAGLSGGSGGGGSYNGGGGGSGTAGQGYAGKANSGSGTGGGGGGASETPAGGTSGGDGGDGASSNITGSAVVRAGGGGGGDRSSEGANTYGIGGAGGGGNGASDFNNTAATAGAANTGSGGGGCSTEDLANGNGGSGVVIIRYDVTAIA